MNPRHSCAGQQLICGEWVDGRGDQRAGVSPADSQICWQGRWADAKQADSALLAAEKAFGPWSLRPLEDRIALCNAFAAHVDARRDELADLIAWETGKPRWEALSEVATVIGKVINSIDALHSRRWKSLEQQSEWTAVTRYKPHGVMLVLGPFNLPAHLPGAHIVPALLAGNTIVFKPSELTPAVGQWLAAAWQSSGLPPGVLNLVHGDAVIAQQLASDDRMAGVLFTGSYRAGVSLHKLLAGKPEKVLALEMGGNNPLVIHNVSDLKRAVMQIIESAYITSGQRCTCARRLIITDTSQPDRLLDQLVCAIQAIRVGLPFDRPDVFMGTLIRPHAADQLLQAQASLVERGAESLVEMRKLPASAALLSPGLIDASTIKLDDVEHFGPLLCATRVPTLDAAIAEANATHFGLAAGLLADSVDDYHYFADRIRAGIVNWNRQTTGASGRLPFGGVGASGNHAPSGYFAADYCAYPVASLESPSPAAGAIRLSPGLEGAAQACSAN